MLVWDFGMMMKWRLFFARWAANYCKDSKFLWKYLRWGKDFCLKTMQGQSICGCFHKNNGTPQIIHLNRAFHYKPYILGAHPYFWKHQMFIFFWHKVCLAKWGWTVWFWMILVSKSIVGSSPLRGDPGGKKENRFTQSWDQTSLKRSSKKNGTAGCCFLGYSVFFKLKYVEM